MEGLKTIRVTTGRLMASPPDSWAEAAALGHATWNDIRVAIREDAIEGFE
ncbi:MAG: hypothetical protein KDA80_15020 [Planctomycetaceae bacterium]|nr:hypothetical protein [Planctomycetaceae bacterium]